MIVCKGNCKTRNETETKPNKIKQKPNQTKPNQKNHQ